MKIKDLLESVDDFDDVEVGHEIVLHKVGSFGSKRIGTHKVTKVSNTYFEIDREENGKPIRLRRKNGKSTSTSNETLGKGAEGSRGYEHGYRGFKK